MNVNLSDNVSYKLDKLLAKKTKHLQLQSGSDISAVALVLQLNVWCRVGCEGTEWAASKLPLWLALWITMFGFDYFISVCYMNAVICHLISDNCYVSVVICKTCVICHLSFAIYYLA